LVTTKRTTAAELAEFSENGFRHELIRGEVQRIPLAGGVHGEIGQELGWRLGAHVAANNLGQLYAAGTGFLLAEDPDTVLAPDIAFIRADRLPPREDQVGYVRVPPDLVVEVVSPNDRASEIAAKVALYLSLGVRAVWVIEPRLQTVTLYEVDRRPRILVADDVLDGGENVPGFQVAVAELFR
jgi:Uma2 family endonuclease